LRSVSAEQPRFSAIEHAVLSRWKIATEALPAVDWFPAQRVLVHTPIGRVQVLNVHLRPPVSDSGSLVSGYFMTREVRRREIEHFAGELSPTLPTLIVGDFNEDGHGRAISFLRDQHGLRDALRQFQSGAPTWRWATSVGTITQELDHVLYSPDRLVPIAAEVVKAGRSDHLPVLATFTLSGA
jgi:endonuclease/exonuclease/phosphatase family metal-dependent hydrolase